MTLGRRWNSVSVALARQLQRVRSQSCLLHSDLSATRSYNTPELQQQFSTTLQNDIAGLLGIPTTQVSITTVTGLQDGETDVTVQLDGSGCV